MVISLWNNTNAKIFNESQRKDANEYHFSLCNIDHSSINMITGTNNNGRLLQSVIFFGSHTIVEYQRQIYVQGFENNKLCFQNAHISTHTLPLWHYFTHNEQE